MTLEEHINYHEDKINRLYEQHDQINGYINRQSSKSSQLNAPILLSLVRDLYAIEIEIRSSVDTRMTLINIKNTSSSSN